jgi:hypothetical protein
MSENQVNIQFTYTPDDYVEGSRAASYYFRPPRFSWAANYAFTAVAVVGGPWIYLSSPGDRAAWFVGSAVFGLGLWYLYGWGAQLWRYRYGLRREFAGVEVLQGIREMEFDESIHRTRAPRFTYEASWECYKSFIETSSLFVLSQPPGYTMIPKRAFADDQIAALRQLLSRKIPPLEPQPRNRVFVIVVAAAVIASLLLYAAFRIYALKG